MKEGQIKATTTTTTTTTKSSSSNNNCNNNNTDNIATMKVTLKNGNKHYLNNNNLNNSNSNDNNKKIVTLGLTFCVYKMKKETSLAFRSIVRANCEYEEAAYKKSSVHLPLQVGVNRSEYLTTGRPGETQVSKYAFRTTVFRERKDSFLCVDPVTRGKDPLQHRHFSSESVQCCR